MRMIVPDVFLSGSFLELRELRFMYQPTCFSQLTGSYSSKCVAFSSALPDFGMCTLTESLLLETVNIIV
jgi:hypothetical protein